MRHDHRQLPFGIANTGRRSQGTYWRTRLSPRRGGRGSGRVVLRSGVVVRARSGSVCPAGSGVVVRARSSRSASPDRVSCVVGFGRRVPGRREGIHLCRFPSRGTWTRLSRPARPGADRVVRFPVQGHLQRCMPSHHADTRPPDPT